MYEARDGNWLPAVEALGFRIHPVDKAGLLGLVAAAVVGRRRLIVGGANLHGLYVSLTEPRYEALLARPETIVIVDGMPVLWLLRLFGHGVTRAQRITWVDWFEDMLAEAAGRGASVFVLGHEPRVLAAGLARARERWPALRITGADGFFDPAPGSAQARAKLDEIAAFAPDILIVGMGMPRQEIFVADHLDAIAAPVIGLAGAAFGYFAGAEPTPPRWMGRAGLEWLHRLAADPRRLAHRYLVEPALLALLLLRRSFPGRGGK